MSSLRPRPGRAPTLESAAKRVRARRIAALAGMLTAIGGLVGLRATLAPTPSPALGSHGLAAPVGGASTSSKHRSQKPRASSASPAHQVLVGKAYDVHYGIVQVKVTLTGKRITNVTPLSMPQGGRSGDIARFAAPQLRREALAAQSAKIDTVSGASYTSAGYAESLQSALDQRRR